MALVIAEGDDTTDGRMPLEQGCDPFVEHEIDLRLREILPQGAQQRRGQDGIAHLSESYNEYLHNSSLNSISRFFW